MKECHVFDPLVSKRQQLLLAAQLVRAVLKIDDVVRIAQMRNTVTHTPRSSPDRTACVGRRDVDHVSMHHPLLRGVGSQCSTGSGVASKIAGGDARACVFPNGRWRLSCVSFDSKCRSTRRQIDLSGTGSLAVGSLTRTDCTHRHTGTLSCQQKNANALLPRMQKNRPRKMSGQCQDPLLTVSQRRSASSGARRCNTRTCTWTNSHVRIGM